MRQFTSEAAKSLITIIGTEYAMAQKRVERRFIAEDKMLGTLLERLNRMACHNTNLRKFLDNVGHIPVIEDEAMDLEWSKDPRENGENDNDTGEASPYQIPDSKFERVPFTLPEEDEPYDDGKKAPRFESVRESSNVLHKQASGRGKRDSKN